MGNVKTELTCLTVHATLDMREIYVKVKSRFILISQYLLLSLTKFILILVNIDECASTPCQNNGVCVDAVNMYSCSCQDGFEGEHCESTTTNCFINHDI